ncbi:unnamed protein product [Larinioides sclopetarius]|uniref:Neurotransmitter-gated ion-channel transmembrane domain-containing protein n=1 Tax=Larinioides sclopetarius TaxID=280406 RepID=A0AAV2ASI1_9ARAC
MKRSRRGRSKLTATTCARNVQYAVHYFFLQAESEQQHVPQQSRIRKIFLLWLPWLLRMERPGQKITRRDLFRSTKVCEMELKERASRSLLTSIVDGGAASGGEEEFRPATASSSPAQQRVQGDRSYANVLIGGSNHGSMMYGCMHADVELSAILRELKKITAKLRKDDQDAEVVSDWQFAAMVVDRICLINFTIFTLASTVLSLGSAPHLMA